MALAAILVSAASTWVTSFVPEETAAFWYWLVRILQTAAIVVGIVFLVRYVLAQRDDYWRERNRNPKGPTQPGKPGKREP